MVMMTSISKGQEGPLLYTTTSRGRVIIGLGWDAREDKVKLLNKIVKKDTQHDLDIVCYVYDEEGEFIDFVGAEAQDSIDQSGKIYHSGDEMTGTAEGDDEFISAELMVLPDEIHGMVFLVEIQSQHVFEDISDANVRLADGIDNKNLLETSMKTEEGARTNTFVFASIFRNKKSQTGWTLRNISDFPDISQIEEWGSYLSQYVTA